MVGLDTQITTLRGLNTAINTLGPQRFSLGTGGGGQPSQGALKLATNSYLLLASGGHLLLAKG